MQKRVDFAENHIPGSPFRFRSLDALRGIAAVVVIFFHTTWPTNLANSNAIRNSYTAVDLFFMLSGFVIAASYHDRVGGTQQITTFLERRFFRLYPLHWAILAVVVGLELLKLLRQQHGGLTGSIQPAFTGTNSIWTLVQHVLLIQGWGLDDPAAWNPPSWSVSSETLLYGLFALAGWVGWLRSRVFVCGAAVLGLVGYGWLAARFDTLDLTFDYGILRCLAGFPIGVALFLLGRASTLPALRRLPVGGATALEALSCCAVVAALSLTHGGAVVLGIPAFAVLIAVFAADRGHLSRLFSTMPLQFLGEISYSVYLVHVPIRNQLIAGARALSMPFHRDPDGRVILEFSPLHGDALLLLLVALAIATAAITFRFIEKPARQFGRKKAPIAARSR